ncbi:hypothetical protein SVIO_044480 [Streptomyces violaceusniger]|uniref:Uncharacterized protein n=1 Tax=Streptomyces violaceusniger TaxID=68280 RepID=A0A4D4KY16_STRVO|nr:hypothetical protein SVIO_044480 [Streptomyces violaceusniger]
MLLAAGGGEVVSDAASGEADRRRAETPHQHAASTRGAPRWFRAHARMGVCDGPWRPRRAVPLPAPSRHLTICGCAARGAPPQTPGVQGGSPCHAAEPRIDATWSAGHPAGGGAPK